MMYNPLLLDNKIKYLQIKRTIQSVELTSHYKENTLQKNHYLVYCDVRKLFTKMPPAVKAVKCATELMHTCLN